MSQVPFFHRRQLKSILCTIFLQTKYYFSTDLYALTRLHTYILSICIYTWYLIYYLAWRRAFEYICWPADVTEGSYIRIRAKHSCKNWADGPKKGRGRPPLSETVRQEREAEKQRKLEERKQKPKKKIGGRTPLASKAISE